MTVRSDPRHRIRGVYLLTRETPDTEALCLGVAAALHGGVRIVQYRDKSGDPKRHLEQGRALRALTKRHQATLIVNDDVALALSISADGVHLGATDGDLRSARAALGANAILGASCYDSLERAEAAAEAGADYLAFGAFFASKTKPHARRADLTLLDRARIFGKPLVAIGGIDAGNASAVLAAGADAIAVLGAIWDAPDREAAARALSERFSSLE